MSIIKELTSYEAVPYDLAKRLGPAGINLVIDIMWLSYHDLVKDRAISERHDENEITQKWFAKIQARWVDDTSIRVDYRLQPIQQYVDSTLAKPKGAKPTIDFCFYSYDHAESYFGAECKILIKGDTAKYNRYIDTGLKNYLNGRYSSNCSTAALVGYVIGQGLFEIIAEIKKRVNFNCITREMYRNDRRDEPHYNSWHMRSLDNCEINIHHLFFTFCAD